MQVAVDDKHKLIIASEVVNDSSDVGQLHAMAKAAKEALDAEALQALADEGYYSSTELKACEDDGIKAYVVGAEGQQANREEGPLQPQGFQLRPCSRRLPLPGRRTAASDGGALGEHQWPNRDPLCEQCEDLQGVPVKARCLSPTASRRTIGRWEHEDVLERHRARMRDASELMRRRSGIVEHPFGTLKCRAGYRHFLVRGLDKVRGEWSLMALCYNFTRVLNILGFKEFVAQIAAKAKALAALECALAALLNCIQLVMATLRAHFTSLSKIRWRLLTPAA